jgi:hypothetical protein
MTNYGRSTDGETNDIVNADWSSRFGGVLAIVGVTGFIVIVLVLHVIQADYEPARQLMSELALGHHGWWMMPAFFFLASSLLGMRIGLVSKGSNPVLGFVVIGAALCFAGAGLFPLGRASQIHIVLVAMAFVLSVLVMYLFPSLAGSASRLVSKPVSWGLAAAVALSVASGHSFLPMGIGQRLAAAFLLIWLALAGWKLVHFEDT